MHIRLYGSALMTGQTSLHTSHALPWGRDHTSVEKSQRRIAHPRARKNWGSALSLRLEVAVASDADGAGKVEVEVKVDWDDGSALPKQKST